jgi:hypothetical protein
MNQASYYSNAGGCHCAVYWQGIPSLVLKQHEWVSLLKEPLKWRGINNKVGYLDAFAKF